MSLWKDVELRGFITRVSDDRELIRGNRVRGGYYFLFMDYYLINGKKEKGKAKIYISTDQLGLGRKDGIVYYPSNDPKNRNKEFLTAIVNPKSRLLNQRVGIRGKMRKTTKNDDFDIFVSYLKKVKIFPDPKSYFKSK